MRFMKTTAAALALAIGATAFTGTADARHRHRHHGGDAFAAGIFGLAAGALIGSALSQPRYRYHEPYYGGGYYRPYARSYYRPAPVYAAPPAAYYGRPDPWTPAWYNYCSSRYRSFNAETGYFLGYDGNYHFCN